MNKNTIFTLILIIICISFIKSIPNDLQQNGLGCRYFTEGVFKSKLVCNDEIQCQTIVNFDGLNNKTYQMFGIEALSSIDLKLRFKLYPKNLTDSIFLDSIIVTSNGTLADLVLYHSDVIIEPGFMIKDKECYAKLINYFSLINIRISIKKEGRSSTLSNASILGYILTV